MRNPKYKRDDRIGSWIIEEFLGKGGNAEVWRARMEGQGNAALKILYNRDQKSEPYRRFREEVKVLTSLGAYLGVLPLIASSIPEVPSRTNPAWLAMPEATPHKECIEGAGSVSRGCCGSRREHC